MTSKPLDAKAEQSQRVLQILGGGPTKAQPKEKKPKNLEQKIRAVKAIAEAFGFSDSDIETLLKENNYDQAVVINNILDGITPRPGDSWSVVHNKMTKEEREAKKQTSSSQPTQSKGRGRGGRGGSRGDSDGSGRGGRGGSRGGEGGRGGKREGKDNTRGGANGVAGRGGRGGRSQAGSENGHAPSASAPAPAAASSASGQAQPAQPAPTPTQTIVPSGIITSTPNNPAPTIAQIVAGTATVGGAPRPQAQPSQPTQPAPARAAKSPKAGKQAGQTKTATSATPSTTAATQQPQSAAVAQPSPVQAAQQPSQPAQPAATPQPLVEESTSAAAQAASSVAPQKSPTQQPQTQPQQSATAQPQQKSPQQPTYSRQPGYQSNGKPAPRQSQQWKPKPTKEASVAEQFASATAGVAGLHLGPVVLPGEFPSDIDDNSLNFQFGNFHSDTGKPLEPPTETRAEHTQPTPQPQQVQPQQPAVQHLPTPSTSHTHTAAPASSTSSHPHTHHVPHTQTPKQHDQKSGSGSYQGKQHHQQPVSHHVQQTHGLGGAVINQDPQDAHQLHAMHHMTGMDEMSQMYWQPPVLPYPMSPFPHFETDTSAYYDTYQQAGTYHRQQGGSSDVKYPAVGNAALSGNYRSDGKFSGQEGAAQSGTGASTPGQVAGGTPGSPQQPGTQPHAFPMQGSFPTMYPYHFMGQFPSYQPATSPQYPYRMPLFKTSPPYNFNAVNTPGGYPTSSTAGASGYPEDLANAQDFKGNMYAPYYPVGGLQPDTFMMKQGSGAPSAPASSSTAGKAQQQQQHSLPGVVNQDLNSGATKGQQDYAKFRDVYGGAGAGYYPPGPSRSNQGGY